MHYCDFDVNISQQSVYLYGVYCLGFLYINGAKFQHYANTRRIKMENGYFEILVANNTKLLDRHGKSQLEHTEDTTYADYDEAFEVLCNYYKKQFGDKPDRVKLRLNSGTCTINFVDSEQVEEEPAPQPISVATLEQQAAQPQG